MIDPGHGSKYSGRLFEGKIELNIALKLKDILAGKGHNVILTTNRLGVSFPGAKNSYDEGIYKARLINDNKPDLVLRIHSDSHNMDKFFLLYPNRQKNDSKGKVGPDDLTTIEKSRVLSNFLSQSMIASGYIRHPLGVAGEASFGSQMNTVITTQTTINTALSLIEVFGHGSPNKKLLAKYSDPAKQQNVAESLAKGIENYLNSPTAQLAANPQPKPNVAVKPVKAQIKVVKKVIKPVKKRVIKKKVTKRVVKKVTVKGKTTPKTRIKVRAHSEIVEKETQSDAMGNFEVVFDNLTNERHQFELSIEDMDQSGDWASIGSIDLTDKPILAGVRPLPGNLMVILFGCLIGLAVALCLFIAKLPTTQLNLSPQLADDNLEVELVEE